MLPRCQQALTNDGQPAWTLWVQIDKQGAFMALHPPQINLIKSFLLVGFHAMSSSIMVLCVLVLQELTQVNLNLYLRK
jgi:hypothetical protein